MGARGGFNYQDDNWSRNLTKQAGPVDLIIDSAGGGGYATLINLAAPGGRIVNYGATAGPPQKLDLFKVFWKQLHLQGSTMGSPSDFVAMLKLVEKHNIRPVIHEVFPPPEVWVEWGNQPPQLGWRACCEFHTSAQAFGKIMSEIKPRHAVGYHFFNEEATRYVIYDGIRETYDGPLSMATDRMVWNVTKKAVTERMAVAPTNSWAVPGSCRCGRDWLHSCWRRRRRV